MLAYGNYIKEDNILFPLEFLAKEMPS